MSTGHVIDSPVSIELRPYQRDALTAIEAAALRGVTRQVVSLPTGAGKTVIFAHLIRERQTRTLILVHRDELIVRRSALMTPIPRAVSMWVMSSSRVCRRSSASSADGGAG